MKRGGIWLVLTTAVLMAAASGLWAEAPYRVVNGPKNFYYGHISYIEATPEGTDPVVMRMGAASPEKGVLNLPIGPGDTVTTSADRRCEIQFDTGTVVRLDFSTVLKVETILAQSLSSSHGLSNLELARGRVYVMYRAYDGREIFQLLTPVSAVKMAHNGVAIVTAAADGSTETQMKYGKSKVLFGADEKLMESREVKKGERLIVQKDSQFQLAPAIEGTAFELWNMEVNAHFDDLHEGLSGLPLPVQRFSPAVVHFAQTYGNIYGVWLWDDLYGYVWRPDLNTGMYPWGWGPYHYGQWSYSGGQMYWVPQEPWGWIPYHLGVWQWDKKHGWVWIPGSSFAPAWATWDFFFGYASWRPMGLYDWLAYGYDPYNGGFDYTDGAWNYRWPLGYGPAGTMRPVPAAAGGEQHMRTAAAPLPIPSELKGVLKKVAAAYERGDARIRESAAAVPGHLVFVPKGDLKAGAVNDKAKAWQDVSGSAPVPAKEGALRRPADPQREAARVFQAGQGTPAQAPSVTKSQADPSAGPAIATRTFVAVPMAPGGQAETPPRDGPSKAARESGGNIAGGTEGNIPSRSGSVSNSRFRDWNPDVRVARQLGVHIEYSSQRNEVRSPELNLSSQQRQTGSMNKPRMTSRGVTYGPSSSFGFEGGGSGPDNPSGGGAGSSSSSSSSAGSSRSSSGSASSSGGGKSGEAGGNGKIRN